MLEGEIFDRFFLFVLSNAVRTMMSPSIMHLFDVRTAAHRRCAILRCFFKEMYVLRGFTFPRAASTDHARF